MSSTAEIKSSIVLLNGKNYSTWRIQVKMALMKEGLWTLVTGMETPPDQSNAAQYEKYALRTHKALATIVLALDTSLLYIVGEEEDPALVWNKIENQFEKKTWSNKLNLRRRLHNARLREGGSVQEYLKELVDIFDELARLGEPLKEEDKVIYLLASLPESYNVLVTALEANIEVPKMDLVTEKILHEEFKLKSKKQSLSEDSGAAYYSTNYRSSRRSDKKLVCFGCGREGHIKRFCRFSNHDGNSAKNVNQKVMKVDDNLSDSDNGLVVDHICNISSTGNDWIIDSGATAHMSFLKENFNSYEDLKPPIKVCVGDGRPLEAVGRGNMDIIFILPSGEEKVSVLNNVLHVPQLSQNLISVAMAVENGKSCVFMDSQCRFLNKKSDCVAYATKKGKLYYLNYKSSLNDAVCNISCENDLLWHRRFGHISKSAMKKLADRKILDNKYNFNFIDCVSCINGKNKRNPFQSRPNVFAKKPLELIHSDVCSIGQNSLSSCKYFLLFIDDYSRYVWVYFMKNKYEVLNHFKLWKCMVENEFDSNIKIFRTDGGGEFCSNEFEIYLESGGIIHQKTIPKNPEQNGISERMNRTLVEMVRCMLHDSNLPKKFWAEALNTAVYLRNRSPTKSIDDKCPYEILYKCKPDVKNLKIFGCIAHAHVPKDERHKLDNKSIECIFLGYGKDIKGYRLFNLKKNRAFYSRDVIFRENDFYKYNDDIDNSHKECVISNLDDISVEEELNIDEPILDNFQGGNEISGRPKRNSNPPDRYGEWVSVALADSDTPLSVCEALSSPDCKSWKSALESEIYSLNKNKVWDLVELPKGVVPVGCKFIFKKKIGCDGYVNKYKCRLVAQGFSQKYGINFDETFSPVIRFETIRCLIAFSLQNDFELHHLDVCSAFLNGELKEQIFMKQPEGYVVKGKEHLFCRLNKSIYGLKQSPKCWNESLHNFLVKIGFEASLSDSCLYYKYENDSLVFIAVYVDDILLCSKDPVKTSKIKKLMCSEYEIKDLGLLKYFLGVEIKRCENSIWLGQSIYIKSMLTKYRMEDCKDMKTPFDYCNTNIPDDKAFDKTVYKQAIGSLIYLSIRTRPDIAFSVSRAAQKCENPTQTDWSCVKRIFRYLKSTSNTGIVFSKCDDFSCLGYSDSDWAGDSITRKSTSGYLFKLCGGPISWQSRKQSCVALSTAEAEFIALANCIQEALWLNNILSIFMNNNSIQINVDNQSAIHIAKNNQFHKRTKHIDIKFKFIRDCIEKKLVDVKYCCTELMLADFLTKGLTFERLNMLKFKSGVIALNME